MVQVDLDGDAAELVDLIAKDEAEHVEGLAATISDLGERREGARRGLRQCVRQPGLVPGAGEDVRGHRGQRLQRRRPSIQSKELLATAGTIVQVEARHAAAFGC